MAIFPRPGSATALELAPVGSYQTDGHRLVRILEVDTSGALGEDAVTESLSELSPYQLTHNWTRVWPLRDDEMDL